jgi:hypothetical protein
MPLTLHAKVLWALQEQAFERLGGNETVRTEVRLIPATHRDLKAGSDAGKFQPDPYYRTAIPCPRVHALMVFMLCNKTMATSSAVPERSCGARSTRILAIRRRAALPTGRTLVW